MNTLAEAPRPELADPRPPYRTASILIGLAINTGSALFLAALTYTAKNNHVSDLIALLGVLALIVFLGSVVWFIHNYRKLMHERRRLLSSLNACNAQYHANLEVLGITDIAMSMDTSQFSPDAAMIRVQHQLRFSGVFGHKWVMDSTRQDNFRAMLTRIQLNGGKVQFLLLNPNCTAAQRLASYRKLKVDAYEGFPAIDFYKELATEFHCFELKLFEYFPFMRLIFVDGQCAASRFKVTSGADQTLKAPQLVFTPEGPSNAWTMYQPFFLLYDHLWNQAADPFISIPHLPATDAVPSL